MVRKVKDLLSTAPGKKLNFNAESIPTSPLLGSISTSQRNSCSWCELCERPDPKSDGICEPCVQRLRRHLFGRRWLRARLAYFSVNPFCVECLARDGVMVASIDLDHIEPWRWFPDLFWEESNWQSLCHSCHSVKTVTDKLRLAVNRQTDTIPQEDNP